MLAAAVAMMVPHGGAMVVDALDIVAVVSMSMVEGRSRIGLEKRNLWYVQGSRDPSHASLVHGRKGISRGRIDSIHYEMSDSGTSQPGMILGERVRLFYRSIVVITSASHWA